MKSSPKKHDSRLFRRLEWNDLDTDALRQLILIARNEDMEGFGLRTRPERNGDRTTRLLGDRGTGDAVLRARRPMVVCGLPLVEQVLSVYGGDARFEPAVNDGAVVEKGELLGRLTGKVSLVLTAERVVLNFLQHLSGVATLTSDYVKALGDSPTRLLDTRKTLPGYRVLQKYAVATGGGWNHRIGLFDRIMLKDNHLAAGGTTKGDRLAQAVRSALQEEPELIVEVEVDSLDQVPPVLDAGAHVILLDNFSRADLEKAVALIGERAWTEASGGIALNSLPSLANLGLDFVSCGALVHQSVWMDIGMDWVEK